MAEEDRDEDDEEMKGPVGRIERKAEPFILYALWDKFLNGVPFVRDMFGIVAADRTGIGLNGLTHKGNRDYRLEFCGCIYIIFIIFAVVRVDLYLLEPALEGHI